MTSGAQKAFSATWEGLFMGSRMSQVTALPLWPSNSPQLELVTNLCQDVYSPQEPIVGDLAETRLMEAKQTLQRLMTAVV